ncbi:MAG: AEC family transporter, partial [Planctomycetota bacterium]
MDPPAPAPLSQTPPIAAADSALVKSAVDAAAQSPDSGGGDLLTITASVCGVFLVIMIGAFCRRRQWLTRQADRSLANLTANVLLPALFFSKILGDERLGQGLASLVDVGQAPVIGFAVTAIGFLLAFGFARLVGPTIGLRDDASQRSFAICAGICNYGYIPLPLA